MTRETFTRWTCNRCGGQQETTGAVQPKMWVGYGFTEPDLPAGESAVLGHLCGDCATLINATLTPKATAR